MISRRHFLYHSLGAASLAPRLCAAPPAVRKNPLCVFTKHLVGLPFGELADLVAGLGVDGIEAPVRPQGHVEPERVEEELPKLVAALKQRNLEITILTSGINQVSPAQHTEKVLRTAKALGIQRYRLHYFKYDLQRPILAQIDEWRPLIRDLVALSAEIGIQPLVQNHSGREYFGAPVWDAFDVMKAYPPAQLGMAFDIYHATVEGGLSWPLEMALIGEHLQCAYFKDVRWDGPGKAEAVPLGTGLVSREFAQRLQDRAYAGPISLHTEYMVGKVAEASFLKASVAAYQRDLAVLKEWMRWG